MSAEDRRGSSKIILFVFQIIAELKIYPPRHPEEKKTFWKNGSGKILRAFLPSAFNRFKVLGTSNIFLFWAVFSKLKRPLWKEALHHVYSLSNQLSMCAQYKRRYLSALAAEFRLCWNILGRTKKYVYAISHTLQNTHTVPHFVLFSHGSQQLLSSSPQQRRT